MKRENAEDIVIEEATIDDMLEILNLQKKQYLSEAAIYGDYNIPPLHQTLESIRREFAMGIVLKAVKRHQIIGSVRAYEAKKTCFIGKLIVASDYQNQGIGQKLMSEIEGYFECVDNYELFTGIKSEKNLYLYKKMGYQKFKRQIVSDTLTLVFLRKVNDKLITF